MNQTSDPIDEGDDLMTLDPPGSIAVVGAGPLGIEAALYGRFLGYEVTIIEAVAVAASMRDRSQDPLPMLPDRCLSPLALSALSAQRGTMAPTVLPMTIGQWIDDGLSPLMETDLLRDRLRCPIRVAKIVTVAVQPDEVGKDEDTSDIPADFRLSLVGTGGQIESLDVEAVLLAVGLDSQIEFGFAMPVPYLFRIGNDTSGTAEHRLIRGRHEIVKTYAELAGRSDLDLYRPRRG